LISGAGGDRFAGWTKCSASWERPSAVYGRREARRLSNWAKRPALAGASSPGSRTPARRRPSPRSTRSSPPKG